MTLLKVGTGIYVSADEIVLLQTFPSRPARRDKQAAELAHLYKDATTSGTRREPLKTLVHLRCGLVVGSALTADTLAQRSPISAPVKSSTRRNNIEGARVLPEDASEFPIDTPPPAPFVHHNGRKSRAQIEAEAQALAPDMAPDAPEGADEENPRVGLSGIRRLMRRGSPSPPTT